MKTAQNLLGTLAKLDRLHKTRVGHAAVGLVELGLSLYLANLAIPSGDWWEWLLALIGFFGFIQNTGRMIVGAKK